MVTCEITVDTGSLNSMIRPDVLKAEQLEQFKQPSENSDEGENSCSRKMLAAVWNWSIGYTT